jgi:hypothetical protein
MALSFNRQKAAECRRLADATWLEFRQSYGVPERQWNKFLEREERDPTLRRWINGASSDGNSRYPA